MRIIVVVGFVTPEAAKLIGEPIIPFGGWVSTLIFSLKNVPEIEIAVAMKSSQKELTLKESEGILYYYLPTNIFNKLDVNTKDCISVIKDFKPDVIHAEGAEVYISNRFFLNFEGVKVVSIKGVFNSIIKYEKADLSNYIKYFRFPFLGFFLIYQTKIRFKGRLKKEIETYKLANYAFGRTEYDKAYIEYFNPKAEYHHIGESLRDIFYNAVLWNKKKMIPYSIFVSNGFIARKGAHTVIKAASILIKKFPNLQVRIVYGKESKIDKILYKGYLKYLINYYKLNEHVLLLQTLNEEDMKKEMLSANVYVLPSFVENSSNSLGESMSLGVPSIVSYCGGVSSMAQDEKEVLFYRSGDYVVLANQINKIFSQSINVDELSNNSSIRSKLLFDKKRNEMDLIKFYSNKL